MISAEELVREPSPPGALGSYAVERVEPGRVLIRPVSQVVLRLKPVEAGANRFEQAIDIALRWMARRAGRPLPAEAWQRRSFDTFEIGSQHVSAVVLEDPKYWAARIDDADKSVALRSWTTEIGIGVDVGGDVLLGTRLICTMRGEILPIDRTVPSFIREIVAAGPCDIDGRAVVQKPWVVSSDEDVDALVDLLEDPMRTCDVIVVSTVHGSESVDTAAVDPSDLLRRTLGAAHVVLLPTSGVRPFIHRVGREFSVGNRAVRIYRPGFTRSGDRPGRHIFYLGNRIDSWNEGGLEGFPAWIASRALQTSVQGLTREDRLPSYTTVRQAAARQERDKVIRSGGSDAEMRQLFEEDNAALRAELEEQREAERGRIDDLDRERIQAQADLQEVRAESFALKERIRALEERAAKRGDDESVPIPNTVDGFEAWCRKYLAGRVHVHNRALQSAKKSVYRDPTLLYRALLLLRDLYVPMRRDGGKQRVEDFESGCRDLEIENSPVGEAVKRYRTEYTVTWAGQPRVLDWHLKHGENRERAKCFRLYYFWDDEAESVVVGDLPSHLRSDLT